MCSSHPLQPTMEDQEQETKRDPLEAARDDLHNSVSVAGWKEAFGEKIGWIRLCFQISLIVLCGSCIYSNYVSIRRFANASDIKDEITDVPNSSSMPFSNVTVCAQLYFNITFLKEVLIIPESVIRQYERTHRGDLEELYQQLALYLPFVGRPRSFTANELVLFSKVLRANPRLREYSDFSSSATAQCSQMLKRCWFNGIEFDCCANVFQSVDDDGICYLLIVSACLSAFVPACMRGLYFDASPTGLTFSSTSIAITPSLHHVLFAKLTLAPRAA